MSERIQAHIDRLNASRERLNAVLARIGEHGDEPLYSDGAQWTIRQLVIHLAIADRGHNNMVMYIAQGKDLIPEDYDVERYNQRSVQKRAEMTLDEARAALTQSRQELLAWLGTIDDAVLDRQGRHATLRIMTVGEILDASCAHEDGHGADIAAKLDAL